MGTLTMTKQEREQFLAGTHIGVLAVNGDDAPVVTPIWYSYEPGGDIVVTTETSTRKTELLRRSGRATLCAQTEAPPYQYVVVEGDVAISDSVESAWRRDLARRYLGDELGDVYADSTMEHESSAVTVRLTPQKWRTVDYNKQFG